MPRPAQALGRRGVDSVEAGQRLLIKTLVGGLYLVVVEAQRGPDARHGRGAELVFAAQSVGHSRSQLRALRHDSRPLGGEAIDVLDGWRPRRRTAECIGLYERQLPLADRLVHEIALRGLTRLGAEASAHAFDLKEDSSCPARWRPAG